MTSVTSATDPPNTRVWSVSALCHAISDQLKSRFGLVHVRGEISGMTRAGSGHCYLTLKDEQGQLRCAMFRRVAESLPFDPRNGDLVEVQARCGLYEPRGELQLVIESMRPAGAGQLHEAFLRLKAKLQAEGLFEADRKRDIPPRPTAIGVVTSLSAAALQDVLTALRRRVPHIPIRISPSPVQGVDAPASLVSALNALQALPDVEVILLVRGGGSMEDLWAFNDEALARAIVASRVPVVVGVGHETDFTIADFCADLRAPTPTAAAELCALDQASELAALAYCVESMAQSMSVALDQAWQRLDRAERQLGRPSGWLHTQQSDCSALANRMGRAIQQHVNHRKLALQPMALRLQRAALDMPAMHSRRLDKAQWLLQTLDPALVLQRGYAWLQNAEGKALSSVKEMQMGQQVTAQLADGEVQLRVEDLP
ncbi:MAG: exodeoxyribonuclease VII large subunit [Betaproteobacteria bacterium]|nr:exodeoxyribonuclease VII large subunit [Betaproteobacteria bacterium]